MAATLKQELGLDSEIVVGNSGEFTVWYGGVKLAEKTRGVFPEPAAVVSAIRAAMSNGNS